MPDTLMQLGDCRFTVDSLSYQSLQRHNQFRWQAQNRLQQRPAQQFIGVGESTLSLSGTLYPSFARNVDTLELLKKQAEKGEPSLLVDGLGWVWGQWVIISVDETESYFMANGVPQKKTFQLQLSHYGDDDQSQ